MVTRNSFPSPHEESTKSIVSLIRSTIWWLVMVIMVGSSILWVMNPTSTFADTWIPRLEASLGSTFFGSQGIILPLYTIPLISIGVLGCLYIHLGLKYEDTSIESEKGEYNRRYYSSWRQRPVLVKGPLGIVSMTELAFFLMFIALLVWSCSNYFRLYIRITLSEAKEAGAEVWELKLRNASYIFGLVGNICLCLLFFPVTRGSSVLPLFGLSSEASIKYHIWLGHIMMFLFTAHGLGYIVYYIVSGKSSEILTWYKVGVSNIAGEISLLAGLVLWATSYATVRRKFFELFFYTHQLYSLFMIFFILHVGIAYSCITLPGFYLFLIDRYLRCLQSRSQVRLVSARLLPGGTVELNFAKSVGLTYTPLSIMFIQIPGISKLQWHPYTIASNSNLEPETISVLIKREGSWTRKLYQILASPSIEHINVSIEGPYSPTSTHFLRHDTLVMFSGGSGIAPFISIIREIIFRSNKTSNKVPRILLIAAFKTSADLTMLELLLPISSIPTNTSRLDIQIQAYVTREKQLTTEHNNTVRTVWFKPNQSDIPISSILGKNSWLWLGVIIVSSFISFLIILGLITRHYIFPVDHNKGYPTSLQALINMLLICKSIVATSSLAVLWNKKQNAVEANRIQNTDMYQELESVPFQSLSQATKVHFGARPDLKKIISECEGSSIGVLASGPKKLRHDVANICSSGLADNLHFESISFSW